MDTIFLFLWTLLASGAIGFFTNACCCSPCPYCTVRPTQWQMVISGMANGTCVTCADYNGTYILSLSSSDECETGLSLGRLSCCGSVGGGEDDRVFVRAIANGAQTRIRGVLFITTLANGGFWATDIGTSPQNCSTVSGLSLAYLSDIPDGVCSIATATCTATAIP